MLNNVHKNKNPKNSWTTLDRTHPWIGHFRGSNPSIAHLLTHGLPPVKRMPNPPPPPPTSSKGRMVQGTRRPRDASSKAHIIQGTHRPRTFVRVQTGPGRIDIAQSYKVDMLFASILFGLDLPVLFRDSCTHSPGRACRRWRGISGCWRSSASAPRSSGWTRTRRWCFLRLVGFQSSSTNQNVAKVWSHWTNEVRHFWFNLLLRKYSNGTWCFLRLC